MEKDTAVQQDNQSIDGEADVDYRMAQQTVVDSDHKFGVERIYSASDNTVVYIIDADETTYNPLMDAIANEFSNSEQITCIREY